MADTKISLMPAADTLTGTEIVPLVQAGGNVQTTTADFVGQTILVSPATYRTDLGLGTIATQNANNVAISGGAINNTTIGGTTKAAGSFTTLTSTGTTTIQTLTGYLKGTSGVVSATATIPWTDISGAPATASPAYGAFHQDGTTTLTTGISNNSTADVVVGSTAAFPSAGWFLIENEIIQYTGKTGTTFTGITRGALGTTNVSHNAGVAISEVQGTGAAGTIATLLINNTDFSNEVSLNGTGDGVVFERAGLYNVQISAQLLNFTSSEDNVTLWFAQNGTNIPTSASIQQVNSKHGSAPGAGIFAVNIFVQATANDEISVLFTSDTGNSVVATYPAGTNPVHPVSPALIFTATQVG